MNAVLENGRINILYGSLLEILIITKRNLSRSNQQLENSNCSANNIYSKLKGIVVKCTCKITKNLTLNVEDSCPDVILYKLNLYLKEFGKDPNEQDLGIRLVKTIINELCACLNSKIWDYYTKVDIQNAQEDNGNTILNDYIKRF